MLEFALVLPLILLLTICVMELVHTTSAQKIVTQLSREAANMAFRECSGYSNDAASLQTCLNREVNKLEAFAHSEIDPNVVVVLSLYEIPPHSSTGTKFPPVKKGQSSPHASSVFQTRFDASAAKYQQIKDINAQNIYVGEVFLPYQALIRQLLGFFRYDLSMTYDATVA